ncbi:MAG: tetratricopeptide repeat protein [Bacteroidia bacterium]
MSFYKTRKLYKADSNATFYLSLSNKFLYTGLLDSAKIFLDSVLTLKTKKTFFQKAHDALGQYHFYVGELERSRINFKTSVNIAREIGDSAALFKSIDNLATLLSVSGKYAKELELRILVVEFAKGSNSLSSLDLAKTYSNLAQCYISLNHLKDAISVLKKANRLLGNENESFLGYTHLALGDAYYQIDSIQMALGYYKQSSRISNQSKDKYLTAASYKGLADAYLRADILDSAQYYYQKSIGRYKTLGDIFQESHSKIYYTNLLIEKKESDFLMNLTVCNDPSHLFNRALRPTLFVTKPYLQCKKPLLSLLE